jgi:glycosyltransferase involved in cell wall biosynthesis
MQVLQQDLLKKGMSSNSVSVLYVGAGNHPSTFIIRKIKLLNDAGVKVIVPKELSVKEGIVKLFNPKYLLIFINAYFLQSKEKSKKKRIKVALKYLNFLGYDIELIHFQWINHVASLKWLIDKYNKPVLASVRGSMVTIYPYKNKKYKNQLQSSFDICDSIHCVSNDLQEICIKNYNIVPNKIFTNYNGIDINIFKPKKKVKNNTFRIISIGALMWRKGFLFQLLLMQKLKQSSIELFCVGEGEDYFKLQYQIYKLGLANNVFLVGQKKENEIVELLQSSDVYISTSIAEGLSNSVMEAASCGVPAIVFNCEGMHEIIKDKYTGYIVPFGDIDNMVEKIIELYNNRDKLSEFSINARKHIISNFNSLEHIDKLIEKYNKISGGYEEK